MTLVPAIVEDAEGDFLYHVKVDIGMTHIKFTVNQYDHDGNLDQSSEPIEFYRFKKRKES